MKKVLFLIGLFIPFAICASEVENKEEKKIVTSLTRTLQADGTSERILTTTDAKGQFVKTIIKFAKDRTTITYHSISTTDTIPLKDLLVLMSTQNKQHVEFAIAGLKKLSRNKKINALAVQNYIELVGSAQCADIGTYAELQKETLFKS